jgi:hypothetical protein
MAPISIYIRSPSTLSERRFDSDTAITAIKAKLETVTGIPSGEQVWDVYRDVEAAERGEGGRRAGEEATLGETGVQEWECIQVSLVCEYRAERLAVRRIRTLHAFWTDLLLVVHGNDCLQSSPE